MGKLFGTDGVRGVYEKELTLELAYGLGQAGASVLGRNAHRPKIVIGMDTRESGKALEQALAEGIVSVGGEVVLVGVLPTPAIAVIARTLKADAGVVISASHNPYEFNGIKFFNGQGFKLADAVENEIETIILEKQEVVLKAGGSISQLEKPEAFYLDHIKRAVKGDFSGLKVVMDCAHGASYAIAPAFFRSLGAEVVVIGDTPDGKNINAGCGSTHLQPLQSRVVDEEADIGIAFDGDADRCLAVDNSGEIIDGDKIMNLIGGAMKATNTLKKDTVVVTVMSNIGLDMALNAAGCKTIKTDVGDRYVLEAMIAGDYNLGGEQSGHLILLDHNTTGDGMLTALILLELLKQDGRDSKVLSDLMTVYPQILVNARVENTKKQDYLKDAEIQKRIQEVETHFAGQGRVLIRPSGTEPLVRVMIEGKDQNELTTIARELASLIEQRLGS
ncbi:phosphoglucosamine mutase [Acetobacterium sp.]|uniref:phosphoglucosamine mutase n=1 Tax=Acetobacterium sp. TaxID=1872094 RepID=UPI000CB6E587|nr:phosphoglucosamine mutase [Acetobacterium sp.]MDO9493039.1 phosphoglucosamine mutase [Acetobacterium sp.]PKM71370.1 MAG: phosphoglucosamine mutase [Firmicutes bacterium HGW-Firmicutes-17]